MFDIISNPIVFKKYKIFVELIVPGNAELRKLLSVCILYSRGSLRSTIRYNSGSNGEITKT